MVVNERRYLPDRPAASLRALLDESPALIPGLLVVAALLVLAAEEAGFNPTSWYPVALLVLGLVLVTLLAVGVPRGLAGALRLALLLLALYTAWTYLSIAWADRTGPAVDGANRTLLYLLIFALFAAWPGGPRGGRAVLGLLGLGLAGLGLVELIRLDRAAGPTSFFIEGRLVEPAGYVNANVALWTVGLLACLALAAAREPSPWLRGAALGGAGLLAALAMLGQSRGWLFALPVALLLLVVLAPSRLRALGAVVAVAAMTAAMSPRLLAVHDDFSPAALDGLISDAFAAALTSALVLALIGTAAALLDRRARPRRPRTVGRRARRAGLAFAGAAVLAGIVVAIAVADAPTRLSDAWDDFKQGGQPESGSSRFASVGTYRYDFWRVAWELFEEQPVAGIGVENYQEEYLRRGDSFEQPRYAHSLELGVLSQTGLVGAALLFGALAAALVAAAGPLRRAGPAARAVSAGALAGFGYWLLHGSVDWLWEFPALGGMAFALLGLACAPGAAPAPRRGMSRPAIAGLTASALALAILLAGPWLAELETRRALDDWTSDPAAAFARLDRAEDLNPLSARPRLVAGAIAVERGDLAAARAHFDAALEREADNAYALLELGAIAGEHGRRRAARRLLSRAVELRPRDEVARETLAAARRGDEISVSAVNARILDRAQARLQRAP
jgi:tetratricopeptide (TPR) repeat protein